MAKRDSQLTPTTSPSATPINFVTEMPRGYNGKPLYSSGNALAVFMAMLPGISAGELKKLATDHTKHYVLGRHMTALGRCGLKFSLLLGGKTIHDGPLDIDAIDDDIIVRPCNVRPATTSDGKTVIVNSAFKRSAAVTLDEIIAARSAKQSVTVDAPTPDASPAATPTVDAPTPDASPAATPTKRKSAKRKSSAK